MAASAILFAAGLSLSHMCHGVTAAPAPAPALQIPALAQPPLAAPAQIPILGDITPPPPPPGPIIPATGSQPRKLHGRFLHITGELGFVMSRRHIDTGTA